MASIYMPIMILLLALVAVQTTSTMIVSSIDSVEEIDDDITSGKHIRLRRSGPYLTWCLQACQEGPKYMENFCRSLPSVTPLLKRIRSLCWSVTYYAGKPNVVNY
ncbi:unnamed protein product, partial [Rotaria socialis]